MKTRRRLGAEASTTRTAILDATQQLMLDEGYAAVSTRQVAKRIGLAPALVHYYFPTTDDLLVAVYRQAVDATLKRLKEAFASDHPLRAVWNYSIEEPHTALAIEFMAMANHRKDIRSELIKSGELVRKLQAEELSKLSLGEGAKIFDPLSLTVLIAGVSRVLVMENTLGISLGHAEASAIVEKCLRQVEKSAKPKPKARAPKKSGLKKPRARARAH